MRCALSNHGLSTTEGILSRDGKKEKSSQFSSFCMSSHPFTVQNVTKTFQNPFMQGKFFYSNLLNTHTLCFSVSFLKRFPPIEK